MFQERKPIFIFYRHIDYEKIGVEEHYFEFIFQGQYYSHTFYLIITEADGSARFETTFGYTEIKEPDIKEIENVYFSASYYVEYNPNRTLCENIQALMDECETARIVEVEKVKKHIKLQPTPERRK